MSALFRVSGLGVLTQTFNEDNIQQMGLDHGQQLWQRLHQGLQGTAGECIVQGLGLSTHTSNEDKV